jgi:prepilin-type N-terminal cleavage/methylation domain-containing protein/prepilin-type processing-associated H-X9-DG protein
MKLEKTGFTLIELMVVVAIIAILSAILLPSLGSAKVAVKRISCNANLRQMGIGIHSYVADNNSWMPPCNDDNHMASYYINTYLRQRNEAPYSQAYMLRDPKGPFFCPAGGLAANSPCWPDGVQPAELYTTNYAFTAQNSNASFYSDRETAGCWIIPGTGGINKYRRIDLIKGNCVLMTERNFNGVISSTFNRAGYISAGNTGVYPSKTITYANAWNYHRNACNFLFKDGHVKTYKYKARSIFDYDYISNQYAD